MSTLTSSTMHFVVQIEKARLILPRSVGLVGLNQTEDFREFNEIGFSGEGWSPIYAIVLEFGGNSEKLFNAV